METIFHTLVEEATEVRYWALRKPESSADLSCWCAICSYEIFLRLEKKKLDPIFVVARDGWYGHCFIICKEHIVDCTATQFGISEAVVVKKLEEVDEKIWWWDYRYAEKFYTSKEIRNHLNRWEDSQKPFQFRKKAA